MTHEQNTAIVAESPKQRKQPMRAADLAGRAIQVYRTYLHAESPEALRSADNEVKELLAERCGPIEREIYREAVAAIWEMTGGSTRRPRLT